MTTYLTNAFSLNMLAPEAFKRQGTAILLVTEVDLQTVKRWLAHGFKSAIGHESTARILTALLGINVECNRAEVKLGLGERAYVFQLMQRLPEGSVLNEEQLKNIEFRFYEVVVMM